MTAPGDVPEDPRDGDPARGLTTAGPTAPLPGLPQGAQRVKGRFLNPDGTHAGQSRGALWRLSREPAGPPWPERVEGPPQPPPAEPPPGHVAVTFIGGCVAMPGMPVIVTSAPENLGSSFSEKVSCTLAVGATVAFEPGVAETSFG